MSQSVKWLLRLYPLILSAIGVFWQRVVIMWLYVRFLNAEVELYAVYYDYFFYFLPVIVLMGAITALAIRRRPEAQRQRLLVWTLTLEAVLMLVVQGWLYPAEPGSANAGL